MTLHRMRLRRIGELSVNVVGKRVMGEANTKWTWVNDQSTFVISANLLYLGFAVTSSIWYGVTVGTPTILELLLFLALLSGGMLLLLNAIMAAFAKGRRLLHGVFTLLL